MATSSSGGIGRAPAADLRTGSGRYAAYPAGVIVLVRRTAPRAHCPSFPPRSGRRDRFGAFPGPGPRQRWPSPAVRNAGTPHDAAGLCSTA